MGKKKAKAKKKASKYHEKIVIDATFEEIIKIAIKTPPPNKKKVKK